MENKTIEINYGSEKGKETKALINKRIDMLIMQPVIQKELNAMELAGKTKENLREWLTMAAITSIFGLPKNKEERASFIIGKMQELSAECA